jgi:hypothetical protein
MAYDYGFQRECWVHHYLSDWCGDDGFVIRMKSDMRKFNYLGDFQTITGEIVGKHFDLGCPAVDAKVTFTNQRGEITMEGMATIALPSRRAGLPEYTTAPAEFTAKAQHFLKRHHELGGRQAG